MICTVHDKKSREGKGNSYGQVMSFDQKENMTEVAQRWTLDK